MWHSILAKNSKRLYKKLRPLLFLLPPETAHHVALQCLKIFPQDPPILHPVQALGLTFPNPIGLAAGFDKNGTYIDVLSKLGLGFIEIGTVTPKPQRGNPKPRLFRLIKDQALINRMGFNNQGTDLMVRQLEKTQYKGILGINIGKNTETPLEHAYRDYVYCFHALYPYASYITLNVSSPNTPGLRSLQEAAYLDDLLQKITEQRAREASYKPVVLKISPDETETTLEHIASLVLKYKIEGIIATNTSVARHGIHSPQYAREAGGLSGAPLFQSSTQTLKILKGLLGEKVVLIGVGGIENTQTLKEKIDAGARLVQVYTGLIYQGPGLIKELQHALSELS